jgi:hypothetical protein
LLRFLSELHQVNVLLGASADMDIKAKDGSTASDWASRFGHPDCREAIERHREYMQLAVGAVTSAVALSKYQVRALIEPWLLASFLRNSCVY